jgi:tetratricopeptide (TPR) repeat protein
MLKPVKIIAFFVCILVLLSFYCQAQSWQHLQSKGEDAYWTEDYPLALSFFTKAHQKVIKKYAKEHPSSIKAGRFLGLTYLALSELVKADSILQEVLIYAQNVKGEQHWEVLLALAKLHEAKGQYHQTIGYYQDILDVFDENVFEITYHYLEALHQIASLQVRVGHWEKATKNYHKLIHHAETAEEKQKLYVHLAELYFYQGDFKRLEMNLLQAVHIMQKGDFTVEPSLMNRMANLYVSLGKYKEADNLLRESIQYQKQIKDTLSVVYALSLENRANLLKDLGQYDRADSLYQRVFEIMEMAVGKQHPFYITTLNNYAILKESLGEYSQAEKLYFQVIEAREANTPEYASVLNNLGTLFTRLGQYERAKRFYDHSLRIYLQNYGENHTDYITTLHNLAFWYEEQTQIDSASITYQKVLELEENTLGKNHPQYANTLHNLAWLTTQQQKFEEALQLYQTCLQIRENIFGTTHPEYAKTLNNLAYLYEQEKKYDQAQVLYEKSLSLIEKSFGSKHPKYIDILHHLARLTYKQKNQEKAQQLYTQLHQGVFNLIQNYFLHLSETQKESYYLTYLSKYLDHLKAYYALDMAQNQAFVEILFDMELQTKGLLLHTQQHWRKHFFEKSIPTTQKNVEQYRSLRQQLALKYQVSYSSFEEIDSLENEALKLEIALQNDADFFKQYQFIKPYTWQSIQKELKAGERAIETIRINISEFTEKPEIWYVFLSLDKDCKTPYQTVMKNGIEMETKHYKDYLNRIKYFTNDVESYERFYPKSPLTPIGGTSPSLTLPKREGDGTDTYNSPFGGWGAVVYFSPAGVYHLINLQTLWNPKTKSYLLDEMNIQLLNNLGDLTEETKPDNINQGVHLFGYPDYQSPYYEPEPLINTKLEVKQIALLFEKNKKEVNTYLESEANEQNLKSITQPKLLHIATHGYFRQSNHKQPKLKNPLLRSGILLAGAGKTMYSHRQDTLKTDIEEDGILTAYEVMNLNLEHTEMVVLSACETGLGEVHTGEGVYGLQRAFQVAGAKTMLMSLWKVSDDATSDLMTTFYENWLNGQDKHTAFRNAQQQIKAKYLQPYYWGAFVMVE